ncbi:hypothetical protein [Cryptosporidium parvum Iowa II]|uniref:Uncharacterized protein n=2 Tax=Cryptosporidium parvum TaxID=5807 RepID=Q5CSF8_CRYPI|nr:hypothetical protein [Cryptosporidium parvum Iowa II]EAK88350.1 hypothetical protein cgd1_2900 [Cryptosporidium parvum Iowa II]QOY43334.1 Uncharacterized protein CPATCC_0036400 [Cryptosporidium parvum]WKS76193.1 hypothetical protein CPCDC_1g2900 [Cryptosporidium sp. 43IA8]WRK30686.1 Uncharacterized protein cpbgf_1002900 [Cryptosporidium parvum]|eukprot:QOY43334.1 hypothetical protein CPATCC_000111 [Cryptosporidium parvum]
MSDRNIEQLLEVINGNSTHQSNLEKLITNSIPELESNFEILELEKKLIITKFSLGLMEFKSDSKTFHQARMSLLALILEKQEIKEILEFNFNGFNPSVHILHSVEIASLEIRLFLESKLVELEDFKFSLDESKDKKQVQDDEEIDLLTSSFRILDSLLTQLNKDENLDFLEFSEKITGVQVVELLDSLKGTAKHCIEFILDIEGIIRDEYEMDLNKGVLELKGNTNSKTSSLYWIIYYSCSISSKWQINEPDQDLDKYIKLLEIASRYLNPLHFASVFPTLIHISVIDWANIPGILETVLTSMLSFSTLIKQENKKEGIYSGLYYAALLITSAWWSPGIDTYRIAASKMKDGSRSLEYISRNYLNLDHLDKIQDSKVSLSKLRVEEEKKSGTKMPEFVPLDTNAIPEYSFEDNPGVDRVRRISLIIFGLIKEIYQEDINQFQGDQINKVLFIRHLDDPNSQNFEKFSAFIQTLICILTLLTCRIQNSYVPSELWNIIFKLIIVLTPKSSKGYYYDSPRKITFFISLLRTTAIAFSSGYSDQAKQFDKLLEDLKIETTYNIPKLIIRDDCEEFSEQDEESIKFFRNLLDIS